MMRVIPQSACSPQSKETGSRLCWTSAGMVCWVRGGNLTASLHHDTERSSGEVQVDLLAPSFPPPHSPVVCSLGGQWRLLERGAECGVCLGDLSRSVTSQRDVPVPRVLAVHLLSHTEPCVGSGSAPPWSSRNTTCALVSCRSLT